MFVDEVRVEVEAGKGGRGAVSFRREKYVPRGGPDGGRGGDGGAVELVARQNLHTLASLRRRPRLRARNGRPGEGGCRSGRSGDDLAVAVPVGTLVWDDDTGELLGDLSEEGCHLSVARGGVGGRGNAAFASATDRAPRRSESGRPGERRHIRLELRLVADVGLVGFPNAGKSTFIRRVSAARPRVADYPFTTLVPQLGVVEVDGDRSFVIADVPGLIPGAHAGAGLGVRFLRHLQRTRFLMYFIDVSDASGRDPASDLAVLQREVKLFGGGLEGRPAMVVANKADLLAEPSRAVALEGVARGQGLPFARVSSVTGQGVPELLQELAERVFLDLPAEVGA